MTDPLFGTPGWNMLTGMRPRRDQDSAYEFVCCSAPVEGHHEAACPQSPIWAQMVTEQGDPFHIWAFVPWGAADFMHDDYVKRWYWYHGFGSYPQRVILGFDGDLKWEVSGSSSWTLPDYEFGQLIPGKDAILGDRYPPADPGTSGLPKYPGHMFPNPLEDQSPWVLETALLKRFEPFSETLKDLLDDENLTVKFERPKSESEKRREHLEKARTSMNNLSALLSKIGVEMVADPPKALTAAPYHPERVYQKRDSEFGYEVQDEHDGTWSVSMVWPSGRYGNPQFFPNEREAHWFAREMAGGALVAGAMMRVHEKRIEEARMGQRFRDRYSWGSRR